MTIQHNCQAGGCYVQQHCPDWGRFAQGLPGGCSISDIDGVLDIAGHIIFIEWKAPGVALSEGQRRLLENLSMHCNADTGEYAIACVLWGERDRMAITHAQRWQKGETNGKQALDTPEFHSWLVKWASARY